MKYKDYNDYLLSDKWQQVKKDFREKVYCDDSCFLCYYSGDKFQCHHWRYEKDWNNDRPENLILLCEECHKTVHSIEFDKMMHNSYFYGPDELVRYLSHLIKATKVMDLARMERLSHVF